MKLQYDIWYTAREHIKLKGINDQASNSDRKFKNWSFLLLFVCWSLVHDDYHSNQDH